MILHILISKLATSSVLSRKYPHRCGKFCWFFWPRNLFGRHPRSRYKPRHISTCQRFTSTLGPFLSLRGKCHLKSWFVLTSGSARERGKRGKRSGIEFDDSTAAAVKIPPHPSQRISCHRLHRPLSSPAMKQMIKASTLMP